MRHREKVAGPIMPEPRYVYRNYCGSWCNSAKQPISISFLEKSVCDDELHGKPPYPPNVDKGGPLDLWSFSLGSPFGGAFEMKTNMDICSKCSYYYKGRFYMHPITWDPTYFSSWLDPNWGDASDDGATGWDKFKPAKPGVDLGVALAELREIIPTLRNRLSTLKHQKWASNPASNFLEATYGWLPLLSDIKKAINTYMSLDDMIDRIRKMNGQWEKRGGAVRSDVETWSVTKTMTAPIFMPINTLFVPASNYTNIPVEYEYSYGSSSWFEGYFKYYIPNIDTPEWAFKARRKLMGLNVNPSFVWELIPWSWLVDWITNAGNVFSNMDTGLAENLVAQRTYIMRNTYYTINRSCSVTYKKLLSPVTWETVSMSLLHKWQRKHRVRATPFGFGLDLGSFSPKQVAIMAALGLSR